jgi:hypothetical protein
MQLELSDDEREALAQFWSAIDADRYPLSPPARAAQGDLGEARPTTPGAARSAAEGGTSADPAAKLLTEPSQMASPLHQPKWPNDTVPRRVPDWHKRLICSRCGSRRRRLALRGSHEINMVVTGTEGR